MRTPFALIIAAALALGLAGCSGQSPIKFAFVSGSENTEMEPIVQEFCTAHKATCSFTYKGSLDIGLDLQSAAGVAEDAVWPASTVWIDMFDSARRVSHATSIAQMPVILGVRRSKAEALGWVGKPVHMSDILAAVKSGQLKFLMTSATQSNSGASAYLAMLSSAVAGQRVLQSSDLEDPAVRQTVTSLLQGVERSAASSGWLADLYVQSAQGGTDYDAMWNYEAILKETNDKLRGMGKEPLYAVYPADGVAIADSPLGFVNHGRGAEVEKFFTDLIDFLQSKPIAQRIADTGRRIPLHPEISTKPEPDWNFDPTRLVTAIRMPEPPVIRQALTLYQEALRKPSLTALCLDFSGSMQGAGEQQLQQAMTFLLTPKEASEVLVQWSPDDRIIVIPFDARVRDTFEATGKPGDQSRLLSEVADERAGGGTDMYACAQSALARFEEAPGSGKYLPAIVIMTDGRSQDAGANRFLNDWRHAPMRVPVFGITFGDADPHQLDALAQATGGRVFDGKGDLAGAFRAARGYN